MIQVVPKATQIKVEIVTIHHHTLARNFSIFTIIDLSLVKLDISTLLLS